MSLGHVTQHKSFNSYDFPAKRACLTKESEWLTAGIWPEYLGKQISQRIVILLSQNKQNPSPTLSVPYIYIPCFDLQIFPSTHYTSMILNDIYIYTIYKKSPYININLSIQWYIINGDFNILKWRHVSTIFLAIFCWDIPIGLNNRPCIW